MSHIHIQRVLISVSDKRGILELARQLHHLGVEILSTGGTARLLKNHAVPVIEVSDYTGFPEMMDGRVKTLHPKIHAGILGRRDQDETALKKWDIPLIDAVIVNLYPFQETIANPHCTLEEAIENIDIGGPAMIRAAAKNYERTAVIVDPEDYPVLLKHLADNQQDTTFRFQLAKKAFAHTAAYDAAVSNYLGRVGNNESTSFPAVYHAVYHKIQDLRYGENPHQKAAFYSEKLHPEPQGTLTSAVLSQGKPLSFNNIADAEAALNIIKELGESQSCVIVKHANPCGAAVASDQTKAYQNAYATDPSAAFGGIIAFNQKLLASTVSTILETQFVEVLIAPEIEEEALEQLKQKPNIRVLACGYWKPSKSQTTPNYKKIGGGLLLQTPDSPAADDLAHLSIPTQRQPSPSELSDLELAWIITKYVQSNAIVYVKNHKVIGIGAGQMSRIDSVRIGLEKARQAGFETKGAVMASDAFFPFRDGIDTASQAGITAVIQPGGSLRDEEVITAANQADIAMVFTGVRHFKH